VLSISNYNVKQVEAILENVREDRVNIIETQHFIDQATSKSRIKYCKPSIANKVLKTVKQIKVESSKDDKFKITYQHPNTEDYYLIIVMFIVNESEIRLITTHPEGIK